MWNKSLKEVNSYAADAMSLKTFGKRQELLQRQIKLGELYFTNYYEELRPLLEVPAELRKHKELDKKVSQVPSPRKSKASAAAYESIETENKKIAVVAALMKVKKRMRKSAAGGFGGLYGGGEFGRKQMLK